MALAPEEKERLRKLHIQFYETKDPVIRSQLINSYLPYANITAQKVIGSYTKRGELEMEDLSGAGTIALLEAVDNFDPYQGAQFDTYCITRIRGAIIDEIRKFETTYKLKKAHERPQKVNQLTEIHFGQPAVSGADSSYLPHGAEPPMTKVPSRISLNAPPPASQSGDLKGQLTDIIEDKRQVDPSNRFQHQEIKEVVTKECSELEKLVLVLYYYEELTLKQIGKVIGLTESRVSQIRKDLLERLRHRFKSREEEFFGIVR